MLVLARRNGETLMIGDDIKIKVLTEGGEVKLAIEAPRSVRIMRGEVYERQSIKDYMEEN